MRRIERMKTHYLVYDKKNDTLDTFLLPIAEKITRGIPIIFPTETVYGMGVLMLSKAGLEAVYRLKGRERRKPMAVLIASLGQLEFLAQDIPPIFKVLAQTFLPGPLTVILKAKKGFSSSITSNETIAIRYSSHPIAQGLVRMAGAPLALTSANVAGMPSSVRGQEVMEDFNASIDTVIDSGFSTYGFESTIISLVDEQNPELIREGVISKERIEKVLGTTLKVKETEYTPLFKTGATRLARLYFSNIGDAISFLGERKQVSKTLLVDAREEKVDESKKYPCASFSLRDNNFYLLLRELKKKNYSQVLIILDFRAKNNKLLQRKFRELGR